MGTNTMALIQTSYVQAIMTVPQRLSCSAQLSNCNFATCWHIELSILGLLHLSISIHLRISFTCSKKFFRLKITLGLALGESWLLPPQRQKNSHASIFAYFRGKAFLGKPVYITFVIQTHGSNLDCTTILLRQRGACAVGTNTMAFIQTCQIQAIMTVPQRLSFSAQLTNGNVGPCWHVIAHIGAGWHSAFSTFHSSGQ